MKKVEAEDGERYQKTDGHECGGDDLPTAENDDGAKCLPGAVAHIQ